MPKDWTPEQRLAIETRDRTVLLSAAAGSGKTAVLTERIIRALTDGEHPLDLSRLLAVTFTRAAAAELRERIASALAAQVREHPSDARLTRQLRLLPAAKICTIDAFCGDLLRRFATRAGVSDGYRVADAQETDLTRAALMENLIEDAYAGLVPGMDAADFADLVTRLVSVKEESSLGEVLLDLEGKIETLPEGLSCLDAYADAYLADAGKPLADTSWGHMLRELCRDIGTHYEAWLDTALEQEPPDEPSAAHFGTYLAAHRDAMRTLAAPDTSYAALRALPDTKFPAARGKKGVFLPPAVKEVCDRFRTDKLKKELRAYLAYTEEEWHGLFLDLALYTRRIGCLLTEFARRADAESRRLGVYSFAQVERLAYGLLLEGGQRTELAVALSREYDAVCVDEYQDVSPLQHAIFEALAAERTRFLVGDIKQSIYRFRHADPSIFAALRREFPSMEQAPEAPAVSLFMSRNFRCDMPVVTYINHVFDTLFDAAGESIGYTAADRLVYGKDRTGTVLFPKPTLAVFESKAHGVAPVSDGAALTDDLPDAAHVAGGEENPIPDPDSGEALFSDPEEDEADIHAEAMWVAGTVRDLLARGTAHDGITPLHPSDIAILLRDKKNKILPYITALRLFGIPADTPENTDFFSCPEVLLALSLLGTVDNPRRDVSLTATLLSPLYRFTPDDLTAVRLGAPEGIPLYDALVRYCSAHPEFERGTRFLNQLADFRRAAEGVSVDRLLRRLMTETPLMAIAGADGGGGENNLKLLYHYALRYRGGAYEGLYSFIHYVNRQIETGKTFSPPARVGQTKGVSVMTIHSSKGLEFPVVFLADCGKSYSSADSKKLLVTDGKHPVAFRLRDKTGLVRQENPVRELLCHSICEQNAEEELRLLYVAMTRARERLYLSGTLAARQTVESALVDAARDAAAPTRYSVLSRNSYLSLLLLCQARNPDCAELLLSPPVPMAPGAPEETESRPRNPEEVARLTEEYRRRFSYTYPHEYLTHVPGKLSVSRLSPSLLDGTEEEFARLPEAPEAEGTEGAGPETVPTGAGGHENAGERPDKYRRMPEAWAGVRPPDPTERGIASHLFMQFCDFDRLAKDGVESERKRLTDRGYLDAATAALVRPEELEKFRVSRLLADMRAAREVKREFRFHVRLPAADFTADPALAAQLGDRTLLVQGVIDALLIHPDGSMTLVDYKTDRLTREELSDPRLAAAKLSARHAPQLRYYAAAVEQIFGARPREILLYSLHLGDTVRLTETLP